MSQRFPCPECRETIEVSEQLAGLHTQCPRCHARILVPDGDRPAAQQITAAPPPPAPPREEPPPAFPPDKLTSAPAADLFGMPRYEDTPAPPGYFPPEDDRFTLPRGGSPEGWGPVRVGLLLLQIGLALVAAGLGVHVLSLMGFCMAGSLQGRGATAALAVALLAAGALVVGALLFLSGLGVCCAVPGRSGLRPTILAALGCYLVSQVVNLVHAFARTSLQVEEPFPPRQRGFDLGDPLGRQQGALGDASDLVIMLFVLALFVAGHFLLASFLRGVATYFDDAHLGERADDYIRNLVGLLAVTVGMAVVSCVPIIGLVAVALPLVVLIWGIILFVKLLGLVGHACRTVTTALARL